MPLGQGPWGNGGFGGGSDAALTVFDCAASTEQQRVAPSGWTVKGAPGFSVGTHAFVLGSDRPGRRWRAAVGDCVELVQTADWVANLVRAEVHVRPPAGPAGGVSWQFDLLVDGVAWDAFTFAPGDPERTRASIGVRGASILPAPQAFALRLTLAAAPPVAASVAAPHPNPRVVRTVSSASNPAVPLPVIVGTTTPHGLDTGDVALVAGVLGNTTANGYWPVDVVDATHFALRGSRASWTADRRYLTGDVVASVGNFYQAANDGWSSSDGGAGPTGAGSFVDNPGPRQVVWNFISTQAAQAYAGGPGTATAPPCVAVTSTTSLPAEVELPGVYVAALLLDDS